MAKTKYTWDLMPSQQPRERGDFDKDRYQIKGNEIAQMEQNQKTEYNNLLRRMKEGSNNLKLEGMESLMEMKIGNFYQRLNDERDLREFVTGTEAGLQLANFGAKIWKNRQDELGWEDYLNPENAAKYAQAQSTFDEKFKEYHVKNATFEQTLALVREDTEFSQLFEDLVRGKSKPRAAKLMEHLAIDRGYNYERHREFLLKNVVRTQGVDGGKGKTYQELQAEGGVSPSELSQLEAQADVLAKRSVAFIGSAGDRVVLSPEMVKKHINPAATRATTLSAMTRLAESENKFYDDLWKKPGETKDTMTKVVQSFRTTGPEFALERYNLTLQEYAARRNIKPRQAEREIFELMEAEIRNDPGSPLASEMLAFLNSPVPENDAKGAKNVPMLTRKHQVLTETGLLQTATDAMKTEAADQKARAIDRTNDFVRQQNDLGADKKQIRANVKQWLETEDGQFAVKYNPNAITNIYSGIITPTEEDDTVIRARLINIALGTGGKISAAVAKNHGASNKTIMEMTEAGYIHKIEFPPNVGTLESAINTAVREITKDSGEVFKDIDSTILKAEVAEAFTGYWTSLTQDKDFTNSNDAWSQAWKLVKDNKQLILEEANKSANFSPIQVGHSVSRSVLNDMAAQGLETSDMDTYLLNNEVPELLSEMNTLVDHLKTGIRPDDFNTIVRNNATLKVAAKRLGFPLMDLVDLQLQKHGIPGGLPDRGEKYKELAIQVGPVLSKKVYDNKNQLMIAANTWDGKTQTEIEAHGINPEGSINEEGIYGKDSRFVGSSLTQINTATNNGEIPFSNNVVPISGENGRENLINAIVGAGFERHQGIAPGLIGGYNLNTFHTRTLGGLYKLNTIAGEDADILGSIFRSSNRRLKSKNDGENGVQNIEVEIQPNSTGHQWLTEQDPAALKAMGFELNSFKQGGGTGYMLTYVGETKPLDLSITGLANKVSIPHKTSYNEGIRSVLINQAYKKDPMSIRYNGKTFFELDISTQQQIMQTWNKAIQQTAGRNRTPGL